MSIKFKNTISKDGDFHIYSDLSDDKSIYMELNDLSECCFELWQVTGDTKNSTVRIKIPIKSWEKIVKNWRKKKKSIKTGEDNDTL